MQRFARMFIAQKLAAFYQSLEPGVSFSGGTERAGVYRGEREERGEGRRGECPTVYVAQILVFKQHIGSQIVSLGHSYNLTEFPARHIMIIMMQISGDFHKTGFACKVASMCMLGSTIIEVIPTKVNFCS